MKRFSCILLFSFLIKAQAYSCKCAERDFITEVYQSQRVFTGKVVTGTKSDKVYYFFLVLQTFKGEKPIP